MKTIAFYIRNTSQFNNYIKPYTDVLIEKGHKAIILHTNSLTKDLNNKNSDTIEIEHYDIGKNTIKQTIKYLKQKNIEAVISINFHSPMDLLVNRLLYFIGIKSVYMEHGILADEFGKYIKPTKPLTNIVRLYKYLKKYFVFSIISKNTLKEMYILYKVFIKKQYKIAPYDNYLLYSKRSLEILSKKYILNNNVSYSGYPIELNNTTSAIQNKEPYILYIHQPYTKYKLGSCSYNDEFLFLNNIGKTIKKYELDFIIKLHPVAEQNKYRNGLDGFITISNKETDLGELITGAYAVLGHFSTALFYAVKQKKPIIQISPSCYGFNSNFKLFEDVALKAYNKNDLEMILKDNTILNSKLKFYNEYINYYIGRHNSYKHRVETLLKILNDA